MRYAEQLLQSVPVPVADGPIDEATCAQLLTDFDAEYERQFGAFAKALFQAVEVFAVRVEARVPGDVRDVHARAAAATPPSRERSAMSTGRITGRSRPPIYDGAALAADQTIDRARRDRARVHDRAGRARSAADSRRREPTTCCSTWRRERWRPPKQPPTHEIPAERPDGFWDGVARSYIPPKQLSDRPVAEALAPSRRPRSIR